MGYSWHCKASLNNLCLIMRSGRNAQRLEENKCHLIINKEDSGNYRPHSFTLIAGKVAEQLSPEKNISKHSKDKEIIRTSQHSFAKRKSCLTNLVNFCNEITHLVDEVTAVGIYLPVFQYLLSLALSLIRSS